MSFGSLVEYRVNRMAKDKKLGAKETNARAQVYLRSREWSMGNGQCPECQGLKPGRTWLGHPSVPTPDYLGHELKCRLAAGLEEEVTFRSRWKR